LEGGRGANTAPFVRNCLKAGRQGRERLVQSGGKAVGFVDATKNLRALGRIANGKMRREGKGHANEGREIRSRRHEVAWAHGKE